MNKSKEWQLAVAPPPTIPAGDTFIFKAGTEPKPEPTEIEAFKDAIRALTVLFQKKVDDCAEMEVRMHREIQALKDDLEGKKRVIESMRGVEQILRDESESLFDENTALTAEWNMCITLWHETGRANTALKAEVGRLQRELSAEDIAQECLNADTEGET